MPVPNDDVLEGVTPPVGGEQPPADSGSKGDEDFSFLADDDYTEDSPPPSAGEEQPAPVTPPVQTPPESAPPVPAPAVAEVIAPPVPAAPEPVPAPAPVAEPLLTQSPDKIAADREAYITQVAEQYKLTDEDAMSLVTNPNAVLPKLAATLQATVLERASEMVVTVLRQTLPSFFEAYQTNKSNTERGEQEFFGQWSELTPHKDRVMQIATVYRQMNPTISKEQFIRDVGVQSWMAIGLPIGGLSSKLSAAPVPVVQAPRAPTGYAPANPGGSPTPPPTQSANPFENLVQEWAEEL